MFIFCRYLICGIRGVHTLNVESDAVIVCYDEPHRLCADIFISSLIKIDEKRDYIKDLEYINIFIYLEFILVARRRDHLILL